MSLAGLFEINNWNFRSESMLVELPEKDLEMLLAHKTDESYKKGDIIFRQGGYPSGVFYIRSGKVKKYRIDKQGGEQIIYVANAGELIGYHAVLAEDRYPDSAATLESCKISFIPREDFLECVKQSDLLTKSLLKILSHEFAVMVNNISLIGQRSVKERLATQLIVLREKYKSSKQTGSPIEIDIGREDLANLVGSTRENIVRILSEFKGRKILQTKGRKIIVLNVRKLIQIANC